MTKMKIEPFNHLKVLAIVSTVIAIWIIVISSFNLAPINEERIHKERHTKEEEEILTDLREENIAAIASAGVQIIISIIFFLRTIKCLKLWMLGQATAGFAAGCCLAVSIYEKSWVDTREKVFIGALGTDVVFSIVGIIYAYKSEEFKTSYHFESNEDVAY